MNKIKRVGVDIAKNVFHVHGVDDSEKPVWQGKYSRTKWLKKLFLSIEPGATIGMEACASAHHWARELQRRGYQVKLIAPQFVKPYVKSNKNDRLDAAATCEAMSRPDMRFVPVKTIEQQDIQAVHRIRSELITQRTAKANQIRGLVGEYGIIAPKSITPLRHIIADWQEDGDNGLTYCFRKLLGDLYSDLKHLDERIKQLDELIRAQVKDDPVAIRLMGLRGIGPLTASALSGALSTPADFKKGREFAASLGLTPRQHSTGGKDRLLGISKRGDCYLRKLLVHGARAVIRHCQHPEDPLSQWINSLMARKHINVVIVALANKTARIAWAVTHNNQAINLSRVARVTN